MDDINPDANKPAPPQPDKPDAVSAEQLMKILDVQLAQQRSHRSERDSRTSFRVWSLAIIIGGLILALCALQWMLSQIAQGTAPRGGTAAPAQPEASQSVSGR